MARRKRVIRHKNKNYRSKWEITISEILDGLAVPYEYEADTLEFLVPATVHKYKPDFKIGRKTYIETKGKFTSDDRKKHLFIKEQLYPKGYKIYICFQNANQRLSKKSNTTYGEWCDKHGIEWSHKVIKPEWLSNNNKG